MAPNGESRAEAGGGEMNQSTDMRELLREARSKLSYDPESGLLHWRHPKKGLAAGSTAGSVTARGYVRICLNKNRYSAHRLAWLIVHGDLPKGELDHINGIRSDNRLINLRPATRQQNGMNMKNSGRNKTGYKGVYRRSSGKWAAQIMVGGKTKTLGAFQTPQDAHKAYCQMAKKLFGEFANYGR
jgi:HNH endonuclease/AP2 domain